MTTPTHDHRRPLRQRTSPTAVSLVAAIFTLWTGAIACSVSADTSPPRGDSATPTASAQTLASTAFELPAWTNEGTPREVEVLAEDERVKIAAVALRRGTPLPTHAVAEAVSIQVVHGHGSLRAGTGTSSVGPESIVLLDPKVPHAMTPADDALVVLLVHYFKH